MIEFATTYERDHWYKVARAALKGGRSNAEFAVEIADYVLEQGRKRGAKLDKLIEEQHRKLGL